MVGLGNQCYGDRGIAASVECQRQTEQDLKEQELEGNMIFELEKQNILKTKKLG
jgi:hypothetical protein